MDFKLNPFFKAILDFLRHIQTDAASTFFNDFSGFFHFKILILTAEGEIYLVIDSFSC